MNEKYNEILFGNELKKCSGKYHKLLEVIKTHKKYKIFVFLEEVIGSGIRMLSKILEKNGYEMFFTGLTAGTKKKRFTVCTGNLSDCPNNMERIDYFNSKENLHGEFLQILIGSKAIGESVNLYEVRYFHYVTPHWNESMFNQSLGRTIRENSHDNLDDKERNITAYIHITRFPKKYSRKSIDEFKYEISRKKQLQISKYEKYLQNISVDKECYKSISNCEKLDYLSYYAYRMDNVSKNYTECLESMTEFDTAYLLYLITNNKKLDDKYLRFYDNKYILTEDSTMPFYSFKDILQEEQFLFKQQILFEDMSYKEKVIFLEQSITRNDTSQIPILQTLYIVHEEVIYHAMNLRHPSNKSYNALIPIPRRRVGKMRMFKNGVWSDIPAFEENEIIQIYRERFLSFIEFVDTSTTKFGLRSVLDNKIRLRGKVHMYDKRKTQRGLDLMSRNVSDLCNICNSYGIKTDNRQKNVLVSKICNYLIENNLVFWI